MINMECLQFNNIFVPMPPKVTQQRKWWTMAFDNGASTSSTQVIMYQETEKQLVFDECVFFQIAREITDSFTN